MRNKKNITLYILIIFLLGSILSCGHYDKSHEKEKNNDMGKARKYDVDTLRYGGCLWIITEGYEGNRDMEHHPACDNPDHHIKQKSDIKK